MLAEFAIGGSVGGGGKNDCADVIVVQMLLNSRLGRIGKPPLEGDGIAGRLTNRAISLFQGAAQLPVADGRVDPNGPTLKALGALCVQELAGGASQTHAQLCEFVADPDGGGAPYKDLDSAAWSVL